MTTAAVLFMTVSVSLVVVLAGWCYCRVLRPREKSRTAGARAADRE